MNRKTAQSGFLLPTLLVVTLFVVAVGIVTIQLSINNFRAAKVEYYRTNVQFTADAGLDAAVQSLNADQLWTGSGGEVTLLDNGDVKTTYNTTVVNDSDPYKKFINVTARTYTPSTSTTPRVERKYQVQLRGVGGGSYSVVTGVGGLYMSNNSKIVGGNVYVNGEINMSNSAQIGLTTSPVDVKAAHQNCPVGGGATYPRVCAAGENGQPITLNNLSKIYGEVQATNQTTGTNMFNPGLVAGSPAPAALPSHDRAAQVAAVASTTTGSAASCYTGTKTWTANLKITGDVSISNTCKVTVEGDVWITGKLQLSNSSELIVKNGLSAVPVIMIDGHDGFSASNGALLRSSTDATPKGFRIITYWSTASCSPDCSNVTGSDLYNSRNQTTIQMNNNASAPLTELYARWTRITISNGGNIGAVVGQTINLTNSGTITFGTSVTGVGGISAWVVESYKRTF